MPKKLTSLADLAKMQFENLAPDSEPQEPEAAVFKKQHLEAHFSNKRRAGKTVTLIKGFDGEVQGLKALAKTLKNAVGVGGTVKDGEIIIQGNYREQLIKLLSAMGHHVKRVGG